MRKYSLVCKEGYYSLCRTDYPFIGLMAFDSGVYGKDRNAALRAAKKYCKLVNAKLTVEC